MNLYINPTKGIRDKKKVGVLIANLGTPNSPTSKDLRTYLREFLWDPRVIELPRFKWFLILNLLVLPTRPAKSAELYKKIWREEGSPLLINCNLQRDALERELQGVVGDEVEVVLGMRYGNPSISSALRRLNEIGIDRLFVLPLYGHYCAATTASTFDAVFTELMKWRVVPEIRTVKEYFGAPQYIDALADTVRRVWNEKGEPQKLIMSFHGIPLRYVQSGDPYKDQCEATAALLARALSLSADEYVVAYQSRFGKEEWLRPYFDELLGELPKSGVKNVDVICPGFSADCLETLEEVKEGGEEIFIHAGGEKYRYIPALNDNPLFIRFLKGIVLENIGDWFEAESKADKGVAVNAPS